MPSGRGGRPAVGVHGSAGEASPTTRLVDAHYHPDDRPAPHDQLQEASRAGRPTAGRHRLLDAGRGARRRVDGVPPALHRGGAGLRIVTRPDGRVTAPDADGPAVLADPASAAA